MKFSQLVSLIRLRRRMRMRPCPLCGSTASRALLRYDRYLLPGHIRECRECGMIYYANVPPPADLEQFYVSLYGALMAFEGGVDQIATYRAHAQQRLERISSRLGPLDRVLEIGSGYGYFLDACRTAGATQLYGIEPSADGVAHAHSILGLQEAVLQAPLLFAEPPPFAPKVTVLFHVLEHLLDPVVALARLADWLPDGSHLIIEVPDTAGDWSSLGIINFHLSHASYFRVETLVALLQRHGFRPGHIDQGMDGIYPGNLRVFAQRDIRLAPPTAQPVPSSLAAHVASLARPWSLRNGYPRMAIRLLRRLMRG